MPLTGGLRFACGYTVCILAILIRREVQLTHALQMTRAVLSDAIALVRGDRFATTSFTRTFLRLDFQFWLTNVISAANLTTWGFQDTMRDPHNGWVRR
jgi:hypothetical protein